jgi:hypothetical protein
MGAQMILRSLGISIEEQQESIAQMDEMRARLEESLEKAFVGKRAWSDE